VDSKRLYNKRNDGIMSTARENKNANVVFNQRRDGKITLFKNYVDLTRQTIGVRKSAT